MGLPIPREDNNEGGGIYMSTHTDIKYYGYIENDWKELVNFNLKDIEQLPCYVYYYEQDTSGKIYFNRHPLYSTGNILSFDEMVKQHAEYLI